jgi:hypothetical protein
MPDSNVHPVFHGSLLRPYTPNDASLFPNRNPPRPAPVLVNDQEEYHVDRIVDERVIHRKRQFLICWAGYSMADDTWEPAENHGNTTHLAAWRQEHPPMPLMRQHTH